MASSRSLNWFMFVCAPLAVAGGAFVAPFAAAQDAASGEFPYIAYVAADGTPVLSGPSANFYPTAQLSSGYAVEVYRHDPGGWCAIRPPEGSFSLAPADSLTLLSPRVAEASAAGAPVRVGSQVASDQSAVQVKLAAAERVEVIALPRPGEPFVRIAPPAGEFRWIEAARLSREPPAEATPSVPTSSSGWQPYGLRHRREDQQEPDQTEPAVLIPDPSPPARTPPPLAAFPHDPSIASASLRPITPILLQGPVEIVPGSPAAVEPARYETEDQSVAGRPPAPVAATQDPGVQPLPASTEPPPVVAPSAPNSAHVPRVRFRGQAVVNSKPESRRVAELQLDLSRLIVAPPQPWLLTGLREETAAALAEAQTEGERRQLRELLSRIVLLEEIAQQRELISAGLTAAAERPADDVTASSDAPSSAAPNAPAEPFDVFDAESTASEPPASPAEEIRALVRRDLGLAGPGAESTSQASAAPPGATEYAGTEARYDAVGTLKPVVSRRDQAPQFALLGDDGQIITLVTPSPDLNLQSYIGQRVGVVGARGYMPEYRRAHVTAARVTPLDDGGTVRR